VLVTFCGPEAFKQHRCCHPRNCQKCSGDSPQSPESFFPTDQTNAPFYIPDRIITGPGAELIITHKDPRNPAGGTQQSRVPGDQEYYPRDSLSGQEVVGMELRCKPTLPRPGERR
jgi:hypothetical protein